jgi:hypothetical protein
MKKHLKEHGMVYNLNKVNKPCHFSKPWCALNGSGFSNFIQ